MLTPDRHGKIDRPIFGCALCFVAWEQFDFHCDSECVGHAHSSFREFKVHSLWYRFGNFELDENFFTAGIGTVVSLM